MADEIVTLLKYGDYPDKKVCCTCDAENEITASICDLCGADLTKCVAYEKSNAANAEVFINKKPNYIMYFDGYGDYDCDDHDYEDEIPASKSPKNRLLHWIIITIAASVIIFAVLWYFYIIVPNDETASSNEDRYNMSYSLLIGKSPEEICEELNCEEPYEFVECDELYSFEIEDLGVWFSFNKSDECICIEGNYQALFPYIESHDAVISKEKVEQYTNLTFILKHGDNGYYLQAIRDEMIIYKIDCDENGYIFSSNQCTIEKYGASEEKSTTPPKGDFDTLKDNMDYSTLIGKSPSEICKELNISEPYQYADNGEIYNFHNEELGVGFTFNMDDECIRISGNFHTLFSYMKIQDDIISIDEFDEYIGLTSLFNKANNRCYLKDLQEKKIIYKIDCDENKCIYTSSQCSIEKYTQTYLYVDCDDAENGRLRLREAPAVDASSIMEVDNGKRVEFIEYAENGFYLVEYEDPEDGIFIGYMASDYLTCI